MRRLGNKVILAALAICLVLGGAVWFWYENQKVCCAFPDERETRRLGLMTSLPLYWPLGADIADIASGNAPVPWQRQTMERRFDLVPLDTLSPIPALSPDQPDTDPLAELDYLAVIQPRGLSPADNVALDEWVRAGGRLLLVLDPMLTGEYEFPLGDPRRPTDMALVPPVVARWGLAGGYWEDQSPEVDYLELPGGKVPMLMAGFVHVVVVEGGLNGCLSNNWNMKIAKCDHVGKGAVTLIRDAAVFEHSELAGANGESIQALMEFAFE